MLKLGKKLKEKRLEEGLSIQDIQEKTKLNITIIEALEAGDLHPFSEDLTYVKYYVRSYAKAVNLDASELEDEIEDAIYGYTEAIDILEEERKQEIEKQIEEKKETIKHQSKKMNTGLKHKSGHLDWTLISLISIIIIVIAFIVYALFVKQVKSPEEDKVTPPVIEAPITEDDEDEEKKDQPEEDKEDKKEVDVSIVKVDPYHYQIENWQEAEDFSIEVEFNVDTWISVTKNGVTLEEPATGVYSQGQSIRIDQDFNENDQFTFVFGVTDSNVIKINGKVYELDDAVKSLYQGVEISFSLLGVE